MPRLRVRSSCSFLPMLLALFCRAHYAFCPFLTTVPLAACLAPLLLYWVPCCATLAVLGLYVWPTNRFVPSAVHFSMHFPLISPALKYRSALLMWRRSDHGLQIYHVGIATMRQVNAPDGRCAEGSCTEQLGQWCLGRVLGLHKYG